MLKKADYKIRNLFLLEFTKELINNSKNGIQIPGLEIKEEIIRPAVKQEFIASLINPKEEIGIPLMPPQLIKPSSPMPTYQHLETITEIPQKPPLPGEVDLIRLNAFLYDKEISIIECPGPGKIISVKKAGTHALTQITIAPEEINKIIQNFSEKSRITVIGGIFKASVGSLIITAVISEFVGSRFIIYKSTPYTLIE
ncbi:MAG: hypothetical protein Q8N63_06295 [Nanoarchaeota archaeon]|nr:hypothetical protein [Nanoarchaeota archaeon]